MDLIKYIEDKDYLINVDNYLHAFTYEHHHLIKMLDEGIKSPYLLNKKFEGYFNGLYYVSLMKYEDCTNNVYEKFKERPMFIINSNIKTIYARNFVGYKLHRRSIVKSPLPFRCSPYDNEYQKFLIVEPEDIIYLNYNLFNSNDLSNEELLSRLKTLKSIVEDLKNNSKDISIVDYSNSKVINQEKLLSLNLNKRTY